MRNAAARRATLTLLLTLFLPSAGGAQAWLPPQGEANVTTTFQGLVSRDHIDWKGDPFDRGRVANGTLVVGVEYGLTDLLALDAKVAFVAARHQGADRLHGPLDTGIYHGSMQDARLAVALQLPLDGRLAIAPYLGVILPTHDYETRGHSAPGRRLRAMQVGVWAGRDLGAILPDAYVQGQYAFSLVERVGGMSINRSNIDLEAGYSVASIMTLTVTGGLQRTHGGLEFPLPRDAHYHELFPFHDRVARDNRLLMSAGATMSVGPRVSVYGSVVWTMWGQNTHAVKGLILGTSWTFGPRLRFGGAGDANASARQAHRGGSAPAAALHAAAAAFLQ